MYMTNLLTIIYIFEISKFTYGMNIQCKNMNGQPVDWFVVYKMPKLKQSDNELVNNGTAFYYFDSVDKDWLLSDVGIDSIGGHAIYNTLQQIYSSERNRKQLYLMYNDEKPDSGQSSYYGHTKGTLNFDMDSGFWLIHSVPRFPAIPTNQRADQYSYPSSGKVYGQTMLCVSYSTKQLNNIGTQFYYTSPWIYSSYVSENISLIAPDMAAVVRSHSHIRAAPWWRVTELTSLSGRTTFTSFAKHREYGADLYDSLVAPVMKENLYVESWQHGHGDMPSNCSITYKVRNIKHVNLKGLSFAETDDHSKWCIGSDKCTLCIGDINRQYPQEHRSGGTLCICDKKAYQNFYSLIEELEPCT